MNDNATLSLKSIPFLSLIEELSYVQKTDFWDIDFNALNIISTKQFWKKKN